ncbi:hypothetical protein ACYJW8_04065 [Frateuria aurantia]
MKCIKSLFSLALLFSAAAQADSLADWTPHQTSVNWQLLGHAHNTDIYITYTGEGRIVDITLKSGVYDSAHQLAQVNIIQGYFGCPEGSDPQYLEHAVSTTYDAVTHSPVANSEAALSDDHIPVTPGSVIESAAKLACGAAASH